MARWCALPYRQSRTKLAVPDVHGARDGPAIESSLVSDDVSEGQEARLIPLLNEVDGDERQLSTGNDTFEYAKVCVWRTHERSSSARLPLADWGGRHR